MPLGFDAPEVDNANEVLPSLDFMVQEEYDAIRIIPWAEASHTRENPATVNGVRYTENDEPDHECPGLPQAGIFHSMRPVFN